MGLRFDPIGGGQFKQAIKAIMEAESVPIRTLESHKSVEESKLKLFESFKSKFSGLEKAVDEVSSFKKFRELKAELGDGANQMSVTIDKDKATAGSYELSVEQLAQRTSVISNGFSDPDKAVLGTGYIVAGTPGGDSKEILVEENQSSLNGIARLINEQSGFPVTAAVIKDSADSDNPWKLIMTAKKEGKDNQVSFPDFYFIDGDQDFDLADDREAHNAVVKIDGFPIEKDSNDIADFLPGVNVQLKEAHPGKPFRLAITQDYKKVSGKVKNVVDQLNGILGFINAQNQVDKDSDTRSTFAGDTGLQTIEYRLRNLMHNGFGVGKKGSDDFKVYYLSDIGIEFDRNGALTFKDDKFKSFMEKNFDSLSQIFTGDFGFGYQMKTLLQGYTQIGNGLLELRQASLQRGIRDIDGQIDEKQRNLERRQQSLTEQYSRLEASLGELQRQQQYLSASLPSGGGGNLVQQLLGG